MPKNDNILEQERHKEVIADIMGKMEKCRQSNQQDLNLMRLDLDYYNGLFQNYVNRRTGKYQSINVETWNQMSDESVFYFVFVNLIKPAVDIVVSQFIKRAPAMYVNINENSPKAKDVAKCATDVLKAQYHKQKGVNKLIARVLWSIITGLSARWFHPIMTEWDDKGNAIESDVEETILSPFEIAIAPGNKDIDDSPWVLIRRMIDRTAIQNQYNVELEEVNANAYDNNESSVSLLSGEKRGDQKLLIELFEKPSPKTPRGKHIIICDDKVLKESEHPYWDGKKWGGYRIIPYHFKSNISTFYTGGLVRGVVSLQRNINALFTAWITNRIQSMGLKFLVEKGRYKLTDKMLNNGPEIIDMPPGANPPKWLDIPNAAGDTPLLYEKMREAFDEQTGVHALSRGNEPEERMANSALQYITTLDMEKFQAVFDAFEDAERRSAYAYLNSLKQFAPKKPYYLLGEDRRTEITNFLADDLGDFQVMVERGSSIPESRPGRISMLTDMINQGQLPIADDRFLRLSVFKAIDTTATRELIADELGSMNFAKEENRIMMEGGLVYANPAQDHEMHIHIHKMLVDSQDYLKIRATPTEEIIMDHIGEHQMFMQPPAPPPVPPGPEMPAEMGASSPVPLAMPPVPVASPPIGTGGPSPEQAMLAEALGVPAGPLQ